MECRHRAIMPAKGPMPTHTEKIIAHTSGSMERVTLRNSRVKE